MLKYFKKAAPVDMVILLGAATNLAVIAGLVLSYLFS